MINVANGADVDVRLGALKDCGVASCELRLAPGVQCLLEGADGASRAQSARGLEECASERHDALLYTTNAKRETERGMVVMLQR